MCVLKQPNWPYHPAQHQSFFNCAVHSCAVGEVSSLSVCSFCVCLVMGIFWLCLSSLGVSQLQREHSSSVLRICVLFGISRVYSCPEDGHCEDQPRLGLLFTGSRRQQENTRHSSVVVLMP